MNGAGPFPELENPPTHHSVAADNQLNEGTMSKKTWHELHEHVKEARKLQTKLTERVPPDMFTYRELDGKVRLYFLGVPFGRRENTLMYCDVSGDGSTTQWNHLLDVSDPSDSVAATLSKEEQLLQERKRSSLKGLTSYSMHTRSGRVVFPSKSKLHTCIDDKYTLLPLAVSTLETLSGTKLDPKICPTDPDLIAYVCNGDLWVYDLYSLTEHRLTFSRKVSEGGVQTISSGLPSFIIQEEFDRYSGYWWQNTDSSALDGMYRIVYEEVDESEVDIVSIVSPTSDKSGMEHYRYPRAGTTNATCRLKMAQFTFCGSTRQISCSTQQLRTDIKTLFPWCEYVVRVGWCPGGQRVWVQLMDRFQQRLALVLIPLSYFTCGWSDEPDTEPANCQPRIIHEETSDIWINVNNCLTFLPSDDSNLIRYIWASERTGYRHLYHCLYNTELATSQSSIQPLTFGEWQVNPDQQVHVDSQRNLVYFMANKDTPLESHLYCVNISSGMIQRLTTLGCNQETTMDESCQLVLSTYSAVDKNPTCNLYRIVHEEMENTVGLQLANVLLVSSEMDDGYSAPKLFACPFSNGSDVMHAMVYKPHNYVEGCTYPTVLYVYGGPQVQMVINANRTSRLMRLHTLASLGYAVVCVDGRGSIGRGLQWESHIKGRMGTVEIADQVEGLEFLASELGYIDMDRVAIHGWSYGGYMSLMALVQRPDIFKLAISGAPVTKWEYYDTGYTERYMSTPTNNTEGYKTGSVINAVNNFPDQEDRLLMIHGMIDENVHLVHTSCLVNELVKSCKPYRLQLYPNERHGIRNPEAGQHLETMVLSFLQNHL